jgi:cysteine desulfurase/selenocysteine lyase
MSARHNVERIRSEFPILGRSVHGKPLIYLDSAATAQKPRAVLDRMREYYETENANVHRGVHHLSELATRAIEDARARVQRFINAREVHEVVFVRGATEAINLVAQTWGRRHVGAGDRIVLSTMEHHSNIVPWQLLCEEKGASLGVIPITDLGEIVLEEYERLLEPPTRLVALGHVSNSLGTVNPVRHVVAMAHARGIPVLIDGAQAVPHLRVDVRALDCDFYVFSGHKLYGPTGIGILYGKEELLDAMPPYQGGGDMISSVTFTKTEYNKLPYRFEAGTPNIAGAIGLGAAISYLETLDIEALFAYEHELLDHATEALSSLPKVRILGTAPHKAAVLSFVMEDIHPHDIGTILDQEGIAIRTGHHCAQPVMDRFGVPATARASLGLYNTRDEVDALVAGLRKVLEVFS